MKHILFLGRNGFFKRDFQRFQIKELSRKFKVSFLDLSNLCNKKFYNKEKREIFKTKQLIKFNSVEHFNKYIREKKINCVLDISNPNSKALNIFRSIINKNNIKLVNFQTSLYPIFKRNFFLKVKYFLRVVFFNKDLLLYYTKRLFKLKIFFEKKYYNFFYDLIFCVGDAGTNMSYENKKKFKYVFANSLIASASFELEKRMAISSSFLNEQSASMLANSFAFTELLPTIILDGYKLSCKAFPSLRNSGENIISP